VLFAPGLPDLAAVHAVGTTVAQPVHGMVGLKGTACTVAELAAAGVRRISLATSRSRAAMRSRRHAAREGQARGPFGSLDHAMTTPEWHAFMPG
jgi:2-methylisocitrate lyase-like PEP mutase family enzyme